MKFLNFFKKKATLKNEDKTLPVPLSENRIENDMKAVLATQSVEVTKVITDEEALEYAKEACRRLKADTEIPYLEMSLLDTTPSLLESKIGGIPYLPKNMEVPKASDGVSMLLLAQINCEDLLGLSDYPHRGILQFWLKPVGLWDEAKVVYHQHIDMSSIDYDAAESREAFSLDDNVIFPVMGSYGIAFEASTKSMSRDDCRLKALFCQYYTELSGVHIYDPEDAGIDVYYEFENYQDSVDGYGTKIGGYETTTQMTQYDDYDEEAPKIDIFSDDSDVLLFQSDSEHCRYDAELKVKVYGRVRWGDLGVARFHIKRRDLKNLDFSNVWFSWDCS